MGNLLPLMTILVQTGLAGQLKPDLEMMAVCKVSIPGLKTGKEQTSEVKRGRDPIFNQEFFFDHVTLEDLDTKNIAISAYHHGGAKLGKDLLIGEASVPLREIRELNTKKEVKIIEEIKQQIPKEPCASSSHSRDCDSAIIVFLSDSGNHRQKRMAMLFTSAPSDRMIGLCQMILVIDGFIAEEIEATNKASTG
ncbi:unnamed protein product [Heligmosomoides polygyrus]|uniref:C2 domain-containing protein n=1 Tax=Heligmosomoides polygyrus TaxID=6339 RepID=A0A3P7XTH4_HELPZ|nr:unnamed protein product [Heligmosomoides polygyrus]